MTDKNIRWVITGAAMASLLTAVCSDANAQKKPNANPILQRYLDCINNTAKLQKQEGSDKLSSAQSVIASCEQQKQELLQSSPGSRTNQLVARIEQHLKQREKPK